MRFLILAAIVVALLVGAGGRAAIAQSASVRELTLGTSSAGRPISAVRIGDGARKFVLVGDTHGGPEANTYALAGQLADYFRAHPEAVPASVSLYIIPTLNPDGLALSTRFNARGVDLNRNMDTSADACPDNDWTIHVQGAYGIESDTGGPYAESESESRLIRDFLLDAAGVIFYHSSGGDVFPAACEHAPSIALAQTYAAATGYQYDRYWPNYLITGGMHDWAGGMGIAAITPELINGVDADYDQNLAGVQAVLNDAEALLPLPADRMAGDIPIPALIWRYWQSHGGSERFGAPLAAAEHVGPITRQFFERAVLEIHPDQADTPFLVQLAPLGRAAAGQPFAPVAADEGARFFAQTGHTLREAFADYWERSDGLNLFGYPISEEFAAPTADGQRRIVQYFERAIFAYYPEDGSVRLEPLGWSALIQQRLRAPTAVQQIR